MKIGDFSLMISQWGPEPLTPKELIDVARHAEDLGFHSVGIPHVPILPYPEERPATPETDPYQVTIAKPWKYIPNHLRDYQYDALVLVPMLIQATRQIKIGFNVAVTPWFHPFQWAKYLASIDAASNGRLLAGFGLGYAPPKAPAKALDNIGIDGSKRGAMSTESLEFMTRLWTSDKPVSFEGQFYKGIDLVVEPKPVQKPYPELWWAGDAPVAVSRAAKYARYMMMGYPMLSATRERARQLKEETQRQGTDCRLAATIYAIVVPGADQDVALGDKFFEVRPDREAHKSLPVGGPEHCASVIRAFEDSGVAHIALDMHRHGRDSIKVHHLQMELFVREVIPLLA